MSAWRQMNIVARNDWAGDIPAAGTPGRILLPAPRVWLHHGAAGSSTIATARSYARYHIENRGWLDVGYSFVVAEGKVLEGRGAGRQGAHTAGQNTTSHGICIAGEYTSRPPSDEDLDALRWLLAHGAEQGWWPTAQLTGGHRDAPGASTACPGDALYALVPQINGSPAGDIVRTLRLTFPRLRGNDVKEWQTRIGATADGIFGPDTDAATRAMQADLGVKVDGIVGPKTRAAATPAPAPEPENEEDGMLFVVRNGDDGPRVARVQTILREAGQVAGLGELLPEFGADGDYGSETAGAVDKLAPLVGDGFPTSGSTGCDMLLIDWCRSVITADSGGRYIAYGSTVTLS